MALFALAFALLGQTSSPPEVEIAFRTVAFGTNGKIKDGGAVVMRNDAALDAYRLSMGTKDTRKPNVDWSKEELVALHASGTGYGASSLQVNKVRKKSDGSLEIEAFLDRGNQPAIPQPGDLRVLRKVGLYAMIAVEKATGEVSLKIVDPPKDRGDKSGTPASR